MKTSQLVVLASLVALAGCADALEGGSGGGEDAGGQGGNLGDMGAGTAGDGPLVGEGPKQEVQLSSGSDTSGTGSPIGTGGSPPDSGSGGSGGIADECLTCCTGAPTPGDTPTYLRVDDSSSFASPLLTRAMIDRWDGARPLPVRAHEYLNFYPPRVDTQPSSQGFAVDVGAMPIASPSINQVFAVDVAVRHVPEAPTNRRTIALVVDTSPSAASAVDELLGSVDAVFHQASGEDVVGVYSWSPDPQARLIRAFAPVENVEDEIGYVRETVMAQLALRDEAASLGDPLLAAIDAAQLKAVSMGGEGTVVLVSDGSAGVDDSLIDEVGRAAARDDGKVRVIGVGVGDALYYSDDVLDRITDASGGAYVYFDGSSEAEALLGSRFRELSEVAAFDVRLRLDLPESVTIMKADGDERDIGTADAVIGQNIGWGGTMTFHQRLQWNGGEDTECDQIHWYVVRGRGDPTTEEHLADGTFLVGNVFGGLNVTDSIRQSTAVVAAADALRGPTRERLKAAITTFGEVYGALEADGLWATSGLPDLCETVLTACKHKGYECGSCDFDMLAGEGSTP